MLFLSFKLCKS